MARWRFVRRPMCCPCVKTGDCPHRSSPSGDLAGRWFAHVLRRHSFRIDSALEIDSSSNQILKVLQIEAAGASVRVPSLYASSGERRFTLIWNGAANALDRPHAAELCLFDPSREIQKRLFGVAKKHRGLRVDEKIVLHARKAFSWAALQRNHTGGL